ncbi:hypothetical protein QOZ80_2BG0192600 [Eleusine coracana subsp. coracana]|nr:hypothetical protein QOZ80_2BG0192600 [Eleusine coracana subsp. coracana]
MSRRSKREVAPPPSQISSTRSTSTPSWAGPLLPDVVSAVGSLSGEAMAPPPGWWTAQPPLPAAAYGASWGAYGHGVPDAPVKEVFSSDAMESPSGGFLSFLQNGSAFYPPSWSSMGIVGAASGSNTATAINIDDNTNVRTEKRLAWTSDEEKRLVSAWVRHSNDPIDGNSKKTDQYWGDVLAEYDLSTPVNRRRKVKHLKDRFQKIKRWVGFFCGS